MSLRTVGARAVTAGLGTVPMAAAASRLWRERLRVVAYHRVPDAAAFERQIRYLAAHYRPVSEREVRDAVAGGAPLPERAVWVTFDDGDPTVVDRGMAVLARHRIHATVYVCPGLVEHGAAAWWRVVEAAGAEGVGAEIDGQHLVGTPLVLALKRVPDARRRAVVAELAPAAAAHLGDREALTVDDLRRWVDAGHTVGNHTWDHPCLDRCTVDEQAEQIARAHAWLLEFQPDHHPTFAYPNGDRTDDAEAVLVGLGYDIALLFDHQLAVLGGVPSGLRLSRLRLDADAPLGRARAVLSGAHSALLGLGG